MKFGAAKVSDGQLNKENPVPLQQALEPHYIH